MRAFFATTLTFLIVGLLSCSSYASDYRNLVAQIRNKHIIWDANPGGLFVRELGKPEKKILTLGTSCRPFLIEALSDRSRYVAAHILLIKMQPGGYFEGSSSEWNHLRIDLYGDGRVVISNGQQPKIRRLWVHP